MRRAVLDGRVRQDGGACGNRTERCRCCDQLFATPLNGLNTLAPASQIMPTMIVAPNGRPAACQATVASDPERADEAG